MCPKRRAHWCHLANTTERVLPSVHPSPQLMAKSAYNLQWAPFPQNCPFPRGDLDPHVRHDSLDPSQPTDQMASLLVQPFLHRWPQSNGTPLPPSKLPLPMGGSGAPSNTMFPGPNRVLNPNGISIGSAILAGLTSVTDWQTTLLGRSQQTASMYIVLIVLWCGLKSKDTNKSAQKQYKTWSEKFYISVLFDHSYIWGKFHQNWH